MKKNLLKKKELLDFLSEMLSEVFEEQGKIREQIQQYNEEIKRVNQHIAEISVNENTGDNLFSPFAAKEANKKKEYLSQISKLQNSVFDLQDRMVHIQDRIEKIKSLSIIVDEQFEGESKKEETTFEKIRSLEIQEIERKRISMELHDTTVQNLTTLIHKTELCLKLMDRDLVRAKLEMQTMKDTLRMTINELREMIYHLRPMSIDDIGLVATLQRVVKQNELENSPVTLKLNVINKEIPTIPVVNITLFRVIQEALQNTKKYANATEFKITLIYEEDQIRLFLRDNGVGFDIAEMDDKEKNKHFGLSIMKERIDLLSGFINMESEKDKGTEIQIEVPIL